MKPADKAPLTAIELVRSFHAAGLPPEWMSVLVGPPEEIVVQSEAILRENAGRPGFIFNLGHGIWPETPVEHVALLVQTVRRFRSPAVGLP